MVSESYKCETCGYIIEEVTAESGDKLPKRKKCPECETMTCHRVWMSSIHIPSGFRATESNRGINKYKEGLKKSPLKKKHIY